MNKKTKIALALSGIIILGVGTFSQGIFKKIGRGIASLGKKDTWTKAGKGIAKGATVVGKGLVKGATVVGEGVVKGAKEVGKFAKTAWNKITECAEAVGLGAALGAEMAAYEIAKAGLDVAKAGIDVAKGSVTAANATLVAAEHTSAGLFTAADKAQQGVVEASKGVQIAATETAKVAIKAPGYTLQGLSVLLKKTINVEECFLKSKVKDWPAGKMPKFRMKGIIFGKNFNFDIQPDFKDIPKFFKNIFEEVFG